MVILPSGFRGGKSGKISGPGSWFSRMISVSGQMMSVRLIPHDFSMI
jgi:hypothetical protein